MLHRIGPVGGMIAAFTACVALGAPASAANGEVPRGTPSISTADGNAAAHVAECPGCKHAASSVKVLDVESTYYNAPHINHAFSAKLLQCYRHEGWQPDEKQLDYLVAYNAETGRVTSVKGAMFGKQANHDLLVCINHELTGVEIGKVRKDPEVHGFAMTVRAEP